MRISIVIPMFNEKDFIRRAVSELDMLCSGMDAAAAAAGKRPYEWELIFSNDGSKDGCEQILAELALSDPRLVGVGSSVNQGKGAAIRVGVAASTGDILLYTDCDLAYGIEQIRGILEEHIKGGAELTIGSRRRHPKGYEGYTFLRKAASVIYLKVIQIFAGLKVSDSQTGLKCFDGEVARDIFRRCQINRFAFDLEVLLYAKKKNCRIREYPVYVLHSDEELGRTSKVHLVKDTLRMLRDIVKIKRRLRREEM